MRVEGRSDGVWTAKIPADDPEIEEGKQVNFIIVAGGKKYFYAGALPYSYSVKGYAPQPQETDSPVTVGNNVGDFRDIPVTNVASRIDFGPNPSRSFVLGAHYDSRLAADQDPVTLQADAKDAPAR